MILEKDAPALRTVEAADAVEQAGLARAVGADDSEDCALQNLQAHSGQRHHAAKVKLDIFERHLNRAGLPVGCGHMTSGCKPLGRPRGKSLHYKANVVQGALTKRCQGR